MWIDGLGTYKQCCGDYHRGEKFCVIGVALDLINPDVWESVARVTGPNDSLWKGISNGATLSVDIEQHYGLEENDMDTLIELNDQEDVDFTQFATLLQSMTEGTDLGAAMQDLGIGDHDDRHM
jgi:hypothetical protein